MERKCPKCGKGIPRQPLVTYFGENPYPQYSYCPYCGTSLCGDYRKIRK